MTRFVAKVLESNNGAGVELAYVLLNARTTAQLKHWMTPSRSDHLALDFFYEEIIPLVDGYVEGYQGQYGKIEPINGTYTFPTASPLSYFEGLAMKIDQLRLMPDFPKESWLNNVVDEIRLLTAQTIYQLRELR